MASKFKIQNILKPHGLCFPTLGNLRGRMLFRRALCMTVKCNYSTINLGHSLTCLAKIEQNGGSGRALRKCPRHVGVCGAVLCIVPCQLSGVTCLWLGRQRWSSVWREDVCIVHSSRESFSFFLSFLLGLLLRSVLRSKAFWWDWQAPSFLWERRKRSPISYFAQLSTVPSLLIEFASVIKLK